MKLINNFFQNWIFSVHFQSYSVIYGKRNIFNYSCSTMMLKLVQLIFVLTFLNVGLGTKNVQNVSQISNVLMILVWFWIYSLVSVRCESKFQRFLGKNWSRFWNMGRREQFWSNTSKWCNISIKSYQCFVPNYGWKLFVRQSQMHKLLHCSIFDLIICVL